MYKILSLIIVTVTLSACSNSEPDSSDIAENIKTIFADCSVISIENVEKTNGIKESENKYIVDAKFSIKNNPSSENENLFEEYINISKKDGNNENLAQMKKLTGDMTKNFNNECVLGSPFAVRLSTTFSQKFGGKLLSELFVQMKGWGITGQENIGKEFSKDFNAKFNMIKTDNGWMIEELAR